MEAKDLQARLFEIVRQEVPSLTSQGQVEEFFEYAIRTRSESPVQQTVRDGLAKELRRHRNIIRHSSNRN